MNKKQTMKGDENNHPNKMMERNVNKIFGVFFLKEILNFISFHSRTSNWTLLKKVLCLIRPVITLLWANRLLATICSIRQTFVRCSSMLATIWLPCATIGRCSTLKSGRPTNSRCCATVRTATIKATCRFRQNCRRTVKKKCETCAMEMNLTYRFIWTRNWETERFHQCKIQEFRSKKFFSQFSFAAMQENVSVEQWPSKFCIAMKTIRRLVNKLQPLCGERQPLHREWQTIQEQKDIVYM